MNETKINSKYKTIGEVAKILNLIDKKKGKLSTHTIRFWEKEFNQIKPRFFLGKRRYYDEKTINILKKIKYLLKEKGMTLKGVKKLLKSEDSNIDELINTSINQKNIIKSKLNKIKTIITKLKEN
jgi:DNA-binding transcriptional MerR regulator